MALTCKDDVGECALRAMRGVENVMKATSPKKLRELVGDFNEAMVFLERTARKEGHDSKEIRGA